MSELRRHGGVGPINFHLKRELTQIRKASRALRDPGTTSSWRTPLGSSSRSTIPINNPNNTTFENNDNMASGKSNKMIKNKVFLHNWGTHNSESKRSAKTKHGGGGHGHGDYEKNGSYSVAEESDDDEDSSSDARNRGNDSKSDTYVNDIYASMISSKCKYASFTPSFTRTVKKKPKNSMHSYVNSSNNGEKLQKQIVTSRNSKRVFENLPAFDLGSVDSVSLVDQSDDTEDYYCNSEDLRRVSAASPFLRNKNWSHSSEKLLRNSRKEDASYSYSTPALSTSSYNRYRFRNPSTAASWEATTTSFNDGDDEEDDQLDLPGRQGCGIPCYWSRRSTPKSRGGYGSGYSPSLSDTLRRKGGSILCGSQSVYRRRRGSSLSSNKRRLVSRTAQGLIPLLTNNGHGRGGSYVGSGNSDDELSTNFGELDLEALSRLDGRRWSSSCRSHEGLELRAINGEGDEQSTPEYIRSLSQKYRPMFFEELIGQNIVVQPLMNAISRGRIAPVYLFQGPRGTGKTSTARIFAAALNCRATKETKPCGVCRECADFISDKSKDLMEVDGTNKKDIDRVRYLLKKLLLGAPLALSRYKFFVVDECHLLPSNTWLAFLKFLDEPPPRVVFIFITTDLDNVPRAVLSRCQKYLFNKIKDGDIVNRLRKISADESLDVEPDALDMIALNADGSLRDAETMLDQLSLLGKRITATLVNELVGVVSDEKLLELLELAMSSDTAETVKRARELMDSGVDPIVLMSQLASLIMDIIAGTYHIAGGKFDDSFFGGRSLTDAELERLKHALKLLSEAEKHLRVSNERSTWFTATLLQLGSVPSPDPTLSISSRRQSSKTIEEDPSSTFIEAISQKQRLDACYAPRKSTSPITLPKAAHQNSASRDDPLLLTDGVRFKDKSTHSRLVDGDALSVLHDDFMVGNAISRCINSSTLHNLWLQCIEKCHSKTLRLLLHTYGNLVSISKVEGVFVAYIAFGDREIKTRAERFLSSITNSFETVLRRNVEVRIVLLPDGKMSINSANQTALPDSLGQRQDTTDSINMDRKAIYNNALDDSSDLDSLQMPLKVSRGSFNDVEGKPAGNFDSAAGNAKMSSMKERKPDIPVERIESIMREQKLETAWLQAVEKGKLGTLSNSKPERNQVLPQDGISYSHIESMNSMDMSSKHWEDELTHEIKNQKNNDGKCLQMELLGQRTDHYLMSPSLLHDSGVVGNLSKENMGYESGTGADGCSGLFCWNNTKHHKRGKVKQGTPVRSHKRARFLWFAECAKSRRTTNRFKR